MRKNSQTLRHKLPAILCLLVSMAPHASGQPVRQRPLPQSSYLALALLLVAVVFSIPAIGQSVSRDPHLLNEHLKSFLQSYLDSPQFGIDKTTRIASARAALSSGDREEFILYITGQSWCGTGGCTLLVLEPAGDSFSVMGKTTIVHLPIRLLPAFHAGHPDLGVWVEGGGIRKGYEARLRFEKGHYPANPSMPPATRIRNDSPGQILIAAGTEGVPLY